MPPKPIPIRLPKKEKIPKLHPRTNNKTMREIVLQRDQYICRLCNNPYPESNLECDHILPLSKGGEDTTSNCQCLCISCHAKKTLSERFNNGITK